MSIPICAYVVSLSWLDEELTRSYRKSGDIIESVMKPQWWVNSKGLAQEAIKVSFPLFSVVQPLRAINPANSSGRIENSTSDVREGMVLLVGEHSGLVYLSSTLVGSSSACLLCQDGRKGSRCQFSHSSP